MIVLGIETSCDETGVALYDTNKNQIIGEALYSQVKTHAKYGGVVPEIASRDHIKKLLPLFDESLKEAKISQDKIDAIAYTQGPGLIGALLSGVSFARSLGFALQIPTLGVHHMEGHLLVPMLSSELIKPPFVALLVSGGHTMLVDVERLGKYKILGETLDDAVGEAFDKTAKMLGLGYPGGPKLASLAEFGDSCAYNLPRPMLKKPGLDFSFSGLKTAVLTQIQNNEEKIKDKKFIEDLAASFQAAAVETLIARCTKAMKLTKREILVVAGGVSANCNLRERLKATGVLKNFDVFFPEAKYSTDNGAMIAYAGALRFLAGQKDKDFASLKSAVKTRWNLEELSAIR